MQSSTRAAMAYRDTGLFIGGQWQPGSGGRTAAVHNPATGEVIGAVALAERQDLDRAVAAGNGGYAVWRRMSAFDRAGIMRRGMKAMTWASS